jgi:hypothetical protein
MDTEPRPQPPEQPQPPRPGHQPHGSSAKWVFGIVGGVFFVGLMLQLMLAGMLHSLKSAPPPTDRWRPLARHPLPPPPRLQLSPPADLKSFRAREETELSTYGWINKTSGVVRVPIERAMALVLDEGFPVRGTNPAASLGPSTYQLMLKRAQRQPGTEEAK